MSWLRTQDDEVLDDRIGDLTDREYRAWHALLQYIARESNEDGIVHETRAKRAVYMSTSGTKHVTKTHLNRLIALELIQYVDAITDERLEALKIPRPEGTGWLRPSSWERYNPPRDRTNAERQRRYRNGVSNGVSNGHGNALRNGHVTDETRARARSQRNENEDVTNQEGSSPSTTSSNPSKVSSFAARDPNRECDRCGLLPTTIRRRDQPCRWHDMPDCLQSNPRTFELDTLADTLGEGLEDLQLSEKTEEGVPL